MKTSSIALTALMLTLGGYAIAQSQAPATPPATGAMEPRGHGPMHGGPQGGGKHHHGARHGGMQMDADGDGQLSKAELQAAHDRRMAAFESADANRDGKLSREEMRAFRHSQRPEHKGHQGPRGPRGQPAPTIEQPRGDVGLESPNA